MKDSVVVSLNNNDLNKENSMELLIPSSLLVAIEKSTDIKVTAETFVYNMDLAFKTMAKYEAEHNTLPIEWTIFQHDVRVILYKLQSEQIAITKETFVKEVTPVRLETKRLEWTLRLITKGWDEQELVNMDQVELRDLYVEEFPETLTVVSATATGGKSKKVVGL